MFARLLTEDGAFVWKASFLLGQSEEKPNLYLPGNKLASARPSDWAALGTRTQMHDISF